MYIMEKMPKKGGCIMNKKKSKSIVALLTLTFLSLTIVTIAACTGISAMESNDVEELPAIEFEDVSPGDWFYRYVAAGLRFGIITTESGESHYFEPDRYVTQGEFITMLGRLHEYGHGVIGTPDEGGDYNERYLEWALENEIVHRYRYWDLVPSSLITREMAAMIVWRYIREFELLDYFLHDEIMVLMTFDDFWEISDWAQGPVERLRFRMLVFGRGWNFEPHDTVTHADALQILTRVCSGVYDLVFPLRPILRS